MEKRMLVWDGEKYVTRLKGSEKVLPSDSEWSDLGRSDRFPEGWWVVPGLVLVSTLWGGLIVLVIQGILG